MKRNCRIGPWLYGALLACVLGAVHGQTLPPEQTSPELGLRLESRLSELSRERLADGSAAVQPQPVAEPVAEPVTEQPTRSRPFSTLPALLLGGVLLALAAFAAGVFSVRRRPVLTRPDGGAVQQRADSELHEQEVSALRDQLAEQQVLNESLQADRDAREDELADLRRQRDEAAGESQVLRMRADDDELVSAHETIDELRVEIERLRGAETDLEHESDRFEGEEPEALRAQLNERDEHIRQLEEIMHGVRAERDVLEQSVTGREAQIQALEQTLDHRDEEMQILQGELASAQQQSSAAADDRVRALSDELESVRSDTARQVEMLQDRLNERHEAEERVAELLERNQQLEKDLDKRRDELIQLAQQNDKLKAGMRDLEFALKRDEELTARLELGSLQVGAAEVGSGEVAAIRETLDQAQQRVAELERELAESKEQIGQLDGVDSEMATLQQQNVKLSAMVVQRDNMVAELEARVAELGGEPEQPQEWTSTVSSLENELRRKTTVIDGQADHLREDKQQLGELHSQIASLSEQLDTSRDESDSLKALLAEAQAQAKVLREELDQLIHSAGQQQADERRGEPLTVEADVETLEAAVSARRELVSSLQSILAEENVALTAARKRASDREDLLVSLENEIAANRITIAALQNRIGHAREHGGTPPSGETQRLERELQRGVRVIEKLRTDLHKWRRRVRPLHEAVTVRDSRIRNLDAQLRALRDGGLGGFVPAAEASQVGPESAQFEKQQYFQILSDLHADTERLENELAEAGLELSRVSAADESRMAEIEDLEAARAAQAMRMDELHHELVTLGINPELHVADGGNVVELQAHRPST